MGSRIGGRCATCGLPGHRYGSTDTEHEPNAVGCVNALRPVLDEALRLLSVPMAEMDIAYGAECDSFLSRVLTARDVDPSGRQPEVCPSCGFDGRQANQYRKGELWSTCHDPWHTVANGSTTGGPNGY